MTPEEQKQLTKEIAEHAVAHVNKMIDQGRIPQDWNGLQLRLYLIDRISWGENDKKIIKDYRNTVLVNGL